MRIGFGNDTHALVKGKRLVLGGTLIPSNVGTVAHSDGDCLVHAIIDALLGALALGDIGQRFPDSDSKFSGISSMRLLDETMQLLQEQGYGIVNIDSTIEIERPRLAEHIPAMRHTLADSLKIDPGNVSVKAKSGEKLDAVGKGEAVRASAVCLLKKI